jgi:hypothetical protein
VRAWLRCVELAIGVCSVLCSARCCGSSVSTVLCVVVVGLIGAVVLKAVQHKRGLGRVERLHVVHLDLKSRGLYLGNDRGLQNGPWIILLSRQIAVSQQSCRAI